MNITFLPSKTTVSVRPGTLLSEAARVAGIKTDLPCGAKGVCHKCMAKIISGTVDAGDISIGDELRGQGFVLACRAKTMDCDVTVELPDGDEDGQFSSLIEDLRSVSSEFMPKGEITPVVKKLNIKIPEPQPGDGLSDFDRIKRAITKTQDIFIPVDVLTDMPEVLRVNDGNVSIRYREKAGGLYIVSISGHDVKDYGLAIDIGTTTVAVHLTDMDTGNIISSKSAYNSQISCGLDIISRIHYARTAERRIELRDKITGTIHELLEQTADTHGIPREDIVNIVIAGNTAMIHLLLGIVPEYIRLAPYTPAVYSLPVFDAEELNIMTNRHAAVYIAPSVGSYVGGDITAGLLCTGLSGNNTNVSLFIDIGTNGEIVLGNEDFLMGCACSAGPAFEGGGIKNGCRASTGAIERVEIKDDTVEYSTIGGVPPVGICGSGVIRLVAEMFKKGIIDAAGKFTDKAVLLEVDGRKSFIIAPETENNKLISISETDIDNLIRAKAAVFSACQTLLDSTGMTFDDLECVYVAGGFGRYLDMDAANAIGLLPKLGERMHFLGNSSLSGAYMSLISEEHRKKLDEIAGKITYVDLSAEAGYMDAYMAALFIPHTSLSFD